MFVDWVEPAFSDKICDTYINSSDDKAYKASNLASDVKVTEVLGVSDDIMVVWN